MSRVGTGHFKHWDVKLGMMRMRTGRLETGDDKENQIVL
jgi:hypothetical protein